MSARAGQVIDELDRQVPGATIYVYNEDKTAASVYSDAGLTILLPQPILTDAFGNYSYYAKSAVYREDTWYGAKLRFREVVAVGLDGLYPPVPRAGQFFAFDALGNPVAAFGTGTDAGLRTDVAASTGASLIGWIRSAIGAVARTLADILGSRALEPEDFGAKADDPTFDNGPALAKMAAALNTAGGGAIAFKPGATYWVGSQTLNGPTFLPLAAGAMRYAPVTPYPLEITGCTKPVVIHANGATIKCRAGLKYGSFNADGSAFVGQATTAAFAGTPYGAMVYIHDNSGPVSTVGVLQLDGNINAQIIGGGYGDTGVQLPMEGAMIQNNTGPVDVDFWSHHHGLDGAIFDGPGLLNQFEDAKLGGKYHNNGRNGVSVVGANGLILKHGISSFSNGKSANGLSSNPVSGIDLESEGTKYVRNVTIYEPDIYDNAGAGILAPVDAANTSRINVYGGRVVGTTNFSLDTQVPRCRFYDLNVVGCMVNLFNGPKENEAAQFYRCLITDDVTLSPTGATYGSGGGTLLFDGGTAGVQNIYFERCTIIRTKGGAPESQFGSPGFGGPRFHNCAFIQLQASGSFVPQGVFSGVDTHFIDVQAIPDSQYVAANGWAFNAGVALDSYMYENNLIFAGAHPLARRNATADRATGKNVFYGSTSYDPPSLAKGAADPTIHTTTVTGVALGDKIEDVSFSLDLAGARLAAWVSAANTVSFYAINENGANPLDLGSGTVAVKVRQA